MRQKIVDAIQHLLVTLEPRNSAKGIRHDQQGKVPAAPGGAGMARMFGAVVMDFERGRVEVGEARAQCRHDIGHDSPGR